MKIILGSRIHNYVKRVGIFLVMVVLIVGIPGCEPAGCGSVLQYALDVFTTLGGAVTIIGEGTSPYPDGATVELVAIPDTGYQFVQWTGDVDDIDDVTSATITITMDAAKTVTANFALIRYNLAVDSTGGGEVTTPGEGVFTYNAGTVADLVANPASGYRFVNWTGNVGTIANVTAASTTITMQGNYSVTANFIAQYDLTIDSTDGGEVITPGEGTFTYDAGTVVDLVATPASGYYFVNWTGDVSAIANVNAATTNITMNGDYSITANFEQIPPEQFTLTISSTTGGSVTTLGEGIFTYDEGATVNLTAEADEGYQFVNWTGDVSTIADVNAAITTITMEGDCSITANFIIVQYDLTIDSTNGGEVITPGEGTFPYDAGKVVDLLAAAEADYQFVNWTGDVGTIADVYAASTTITINGSYSISANFEEITGDQIWDWYDLDAIRDNLAGSYILMNDLDSTTAGYTELASETANGGKGWQPIGTTAENDKFVGSFNGQGYVICDLFIDRPAKSNVGIFGVVGEGGVIENVGLMNVTVTGYSGVGGLAGHNSGNVSDSYCTGRVTGGWSVGGLVGHNSGNISDSYCTGRVTGGWSVGGLVGHNSGNISDSYCTGIVTGGWSVGGLVGHNSGNISDSYCTGRVTGCWSIGGLVGQNEGTASNCSSSGSVTGNNYVGGLAGQNEGTASNCSSSGSVTGNNYVGGLAGQNEGTASNCSSSGSVTGNNYVGGLVGQNEGTASNCSSSGSVTGNNYVGGLMGQNEGTVSDSYSTSSATGNTRVGGLMGQNSNAVSNSYATGRVTGNKRVGGLVGRNEGTVSNSFWDTKTSRQATSAGGIGKTTAEMMDIDTFTGAGWDIVAVANSGTRNTDYIWNIVDGVTYPFLSWQS
jgi:uncharacterized repeat protein (TIGR02543 family)